MYVCMYVCMYACMYVCMRVRICFNIRLHVIMFFFVNGLGSYIKNAYRAVIVDTFPSILFHHQNRIGQVRSGQVRLRYVMLHSQ